MYEGCVRVLVELPPRDEYAPLKDRRIVLGLTASSSIYRSIDLARKLIRMGAAVRVVLTREASKLIGVKLVEWAVGSKPFIEETGLAEHIDLSEWGDALIIAPATLRSLSGIAHGFLDQLLPLTAASFLGSGKKVIVVPTMNERLYQSPQYKLVEEKLRGMGVYIIPPLIVEGKAKYPPIDELAHCIDALINRGRDLVNTRILVTAGSTREYMDPVRFISNPSSGLMGVLIAREASCRGAVVDLVHGTMSAGEPLYVNNYSIETAGEMYRLIQELGSTNKYHAAVFAGAPSDFRPLTRSPEKISTRGLPVGFTIRLQPTPKIVKALARRGRPLINIIFVAETARDYVELVRRAREKMRDYNADLSVANIVGRDVGFSSEYIDACIVNPDGHQCLGTIRKEVLARRLVDLISDRLRALTRRSA